MVSGGGGLVKTGVAERSYLCSSALLYAANRTIHVPATASPVIPVGTGTEAAAAQVGGGVTGSAWQLPLLPPAAREAHTPGDTPPDTSGCAPPATRRASVQSTAAAAACRVWRAIPLRLGPRSALCHHMGALHASSVFTGRRHSARDGRVACHAGHWRAKRAPRQNALHSGPAARHAAACGSPPGADTGNVCPPGRGRPGTAFCCCCGRTCGLRCCAEGHKPVSGARCWCMVTPATWW